jgi:D-alanyl-D-alanine endopeptidase (penicillin-binding protein 7)
MNKLFIAFVISTAFAVPASAHRSTKQRYISVPIPTESFLVADSDGNVLKEQNSSVIRPIASISKLLVALLSSEQDLNEKLSIPKKRTVHTTIPWKIDFLSRKELLTLALVKSDNFAAQILCDNLPNCIDNMNAKAAEIGMTNTHYEEPTGLSKENVSTANDLLKLMMAASTHPILGELSSMPKAVVVAGNKTIKVNNTNPLTSKLNILLSKTGFTNPAGGCLVMMINTAVGKRILILLGSKNARTRIPDMERLVKDFG